MKELAALARVSAHRLDPEESCEEDHTGQHFHCLQREHVYPSVCPSFIMSFSAGNESVAVLDLLSLNPALDPALNPSLTPTVVTVSKTRPKKREQDFQSHLKL